MSRSARDVASVIRERLPGIGIKKLHKLLYYAQGHHLAAFGEPLFSESISAFDMGPVVAQLWHAEKEEGVEPRVSHALSEAQLNTIGYVLARYGRLTGQDLEILSHGEEPWQRADRTRKPGGSVRIENDWLVEFFGAQDPEDEGWPDPQETTAWLRSAPERSTEATLDDLDDVRARIAALA